MRRSPSPLSTTHALEVFLRGFSATRNLVHPYEARRLDTGIWIMADPPGGAGPQRTPEVVVYGAKQDEVIGARKREGVGRHRLCILLDEDNVTAADETSRSYKERGYRLQTREPLFVLDLERQVRFCGYPVRRVTQAADADTVAKTARSRQLFPQHVTDGDADCRLYAAFDGETPVGWVRMVRTHPDCGWVANLYVQPAWRRRGIGRTLMSAMLDDDARYGLQWSVLLASQAGSRLYPYLGYERRGLLLAFSSGKDTATEG